MRQNSFGLLLKSAVWALEGVGLVAQALSRSTARIPLIKSIPCVLGNFNIFEFSRIRGLRNGWGKKLPPHQQGKLQSRRYPAHHSPMRCMSQLAPTAKSTPKDASTSGVGMT